MKLGDAFLMPHPDQNFSHLWFVISDPVKHGGAFIIANITSDEHRAGGECPLGPEDHKWIKKKSFVSFGDAIEITPEKAKHIHALIGKIITPQRSLTPEVLSKIAKAGKSSKAIPLSFKKYL
ncbi:MAG: hypothetical protein ACLQVL_21895 [Terriglobia bacterium]